MSLIPSTGDSRGIGLVVVCTVFLAIAIFAVSLRIWSRRIQKIPFRLNDYAIYVALFFTTCLIANQLMAVLAGAEGQHIQNATVAQITVSSKGSVASQPLWSASNSAVKISILHLYTTIFPQRQFHCICWTVMALTISYFLVVLLEAYLLCRPLAYNWDETVEGTCADKNSAFLSSAIINLLIDLCTVVLPLPMLWRLHMPTARKIGITAMFSLGALILVITVLRIVSIPQLDPSNITYSGIDLGYWTNLEPLLGILNACLPVIRPALLRVFKLNSEEKGRANNRGTYSPAIAALRSNDSRKKRFHRLHDDRLPLTEIERGTDDISRGEPRTNTLGAQDSRHTVPATVVFKLSENGTSFQDPM